MNNPSKSVYDEAVFCGESGFDFLDLTIEGPCAATLEVTKLKQILDDYGLFIVGHTDPCLPHAYPIVGIREACLVELERCAVIFSALGATIMNIHPCYFSPPAMKKDVIIHNIESLKAIAEMAARYGLTIALENFSFPFDRVSTFQEIFSAVPTAKFHLDFGHTNFGKDSFDVFCREMGCIIGHVHFSDNRSKNDDHLPLGVGSLNWPHAVETLKSTGYDATITLEVFCNDSLMRYNYLDMNRRWIMALWNSSIKVDGFEKGC